VVEAAARDAQAGIDTELEPVLEQLLALLERHDLVVAGVVQQDRRLGRDLAEPVLTQASPPTRQLEHVGVGKLADASEPRSANCSLQDVRVLQGRDRLARPAHQVGLQFELWIGGGEADRAVCQEEREEAAVERRSGELDVGGGGAGGDTRELQLGRVFRLQLRGPGGRGAASE